MNREPVRVYLGIGANLGDRKKNINSAFEALDREKDISPVRISTIYETEPECIKNQPKFLNCAVEMSTLLPPAGLLRRLKKIEKKLGRTACELWGPRVIDLDILLYGSLIVDQPGLRVPHPRFEERIFVLLPMAEIAPDLRHPVSGKTMKELLCELEQDIKSEDVTV